MKPMTLALALLALPLSAFAQTGQPGAHFIENWDQDGDEVVSLEDITTRRDEVFYAFDADENDVLNAEEYAMFDAARDNDMNQNAGHGNAMRRASEGMTLAFNDTNGDGEVTRAEFLAHAGDWMALLDRNGDGSVTTADFGRQ